MPRLFPEQWLYGAVEGHSATAKLMKLAYLVSRPDQDASSAAGGLLKSPWYRTKEGSGTDRYRNQSGNTHLVEVQYADGKVICPLPLPTCDCDSKFVDVKSLCKHLQRVLQVVGREASTKAPSHSPARLPLLSLHQYDDVLPVVIISANPDNLRAHTVAAD